MIANEPLMFLAAIAAMTAATLMMRTGGFWLMGHLPIGPRLKRMLEALPGSVICATMVPVVIKGGTTAFIAVGAAMAVMLTTRNDFFAVLAGIGAAAAFRAAGF